MSDGDRNIEEYWAALGNRPFIDAATRWKSPPRQDPGVGARGAPVETPPPAYIEKAKKR